MLLERGCAIDLAGMAGRRQLAVAAAAAASPARGAAARRRVQSYLSPHLSSEAAQCSWDEVDDFAKEVDEVCCGRDGSGCPANGQPTTCSAGCAVTIHQFTTDCADTLAVILEPTDSFRQSIVGFEAQ